MNRPFDTKPIRPQPKPIPPTVDLPRPVSYTLLPDWSYLIGGAVLINLFDLPVFPAQEEETSDDLTASHERAPPERPRQTIEYF